VIIDEQTELRRLRWEARWLHRVLGVSPSGYWVWRTRTPSAHARDDTRLLARIREIHAASGGTFGAPRVHATLKAEGIRCGHTHVARLMRQAGLRGAGGSQVL